MESAKTLSAFALALTLIIITLAMNFYTAHMKNIDINMNKKIPLLQMHQILLRKIYCTKRRTRDNRLKLFGRIAIGLAVCFLLNLFYSILQKVTWFFNIITLDIKFDRKD